jgi:hypothetical protein
VKGIVADSNIKGQILRVIAILEGREWRDVWSRLNLPLLRFEDLRIAADAPDSVVWRVCQAEEVVLLTANRNATGPDSLGATLQTFNLPTSLPVLTISNANRVLQSRVYATRVAERMLEYLINIEDMRGAGRLYLP